MTNERVSPEVNDPETARIQAVSEAVFQMERSIACVALELPAEVWEDVRDKWHGALDGLRAEIALWEKRCRENDDIIHKLQDKDDDDLLRRLYDALKHTYTKSFGAGYPMGIGNFAGLTIQEKQRLEGLDR